ncbi:Dual Specificity Protein Phosphatase 12 [Manis pentadactyla]|nr:Dual Specificity Protein Phosphatase 12 [Manis pentadactyla]
MPAARPGRPLCGAAAAAAEPERRWRTDVTVVLMVDSQGPDRKTAAGVAGPRSVFVPAPDKRETDVLSRGPVHDRRTESDGGSCEALSGQGRGPKGDVQLAVPRVQAWLCDQEPPKMPLLLQSEGSLLWIRAAADVLAENSPDRNHLSAVI